MHGHGRITEHRLGTGRRDVQHFPRRRAGNRVFDRPEMSLGFLVVDLVVGHGGPKLRVPVDQPFAPKDLTGLEQVEESSPNRARARLVERKSRPFPVARTAHHPKLAQDPLFVFVFPGPDPFHERRAPQIVPCLLFFFEQPLLDDGLCGDARVVGPRHPQDLVALHPPPPDQNVLKRVVERMTEVQRLSRSAAGSRCKKACGRSWGQRENTLCRARTDTSASGRPGGHTAWAGRRDSSFRISHFSATGASLGTIRRAFFIGEHSPIRSSHVRVFINRRVQKVRRVGQRIGCSGIHDGLFSA